MLTVGQVLANNKRRHPDRTALIDDVGALTHGELADRAMHIAGLLASVGVSEGDNVGILTGNSLFSAETYLGVAARGAVATLYNWRWSVPELVYAVNQTDARVVFVERAYRDLFEAAQATGELDASLVVLVEGSEFDDNVRSSVPILAEVSLEAPNVIIFTGGTTGFSKGVVLSNRAVMTNAFNMVIDTDIEADDRTLLITPMFHSASLLCWFLPHLVRGASSVLMRAFDEEHVAEVIERHRVTNGFLVPNMARRMVASGAYSRRDVSSFRRLYVGGGPFSLGDKHDVTRQLPGVRIFYQYGLSEAGPIVTRLRPEDMFRPELDGSIGQEFLLTEVSVRSSEGDVVADGEIGEICVRGPNLMTGYYGQPEATASTFRDGWLRTGDLAERNSDGYLFFRDRAKDMIKTGGENVYSGEVEQAMYSHPAVAEAAVVGVPSLQWDEEVRAVVVLREGSSTTEAELKVHIRELLAGYKVPKRIAFVPPDHVAINPSGKIMKQAFRADTFWEDHNS
jgi:fatty-acyl-CoA synthase